MKEDKFQFSNCILFNKQLFFIEYFSGLPAMMNTENGDISYCDVIQGYILRLGDIANYIGSYGQKIYILEQSGKNLIIFDLIKNECQYREISCNFYPWDNYAAFEQYEANYYIFPKFGNKAVVVNMDNDEITGLEECFCEIGEPRCCCRAGNVVWILSEGECVIGAFDLASRTIEVYELKERIESLVDSVCVDENIFFLNRFGIIYKWNIEQKKLETIDILKTEQDEKESVARIIYAGNKLIVFPGLGKDIKILDLSTNEMKIYKEYPSEFMYQDIEWSKYYGWCEDEFYYYFAMRSANYVLKVDKKSGALNWLKPRIPTWEVTKKTKGLFLKEKMKIEFTMGETLFFEKELTITELIKMDLRINENKGGALAGSKIYEEINNINER